MNWAPTADGYHCTAHDERFKRGHVCSRCTVEPPSGDEADRTSSEVDAEIIAFASECGRNARTMWGQAEELLEDGTALDKNTAVRCSDAAVKWHRLGLEAKDKVAARKALREAMAHERTMGGSRGRA